MANQTNAFRAKFGPKVLELAEDYVTLSPRAAKCLQQDILDLMEDSYDDAWDDGYKFGFRDGAGSTGPTET